MSVAETLEAAEKESAMRQGEIGAAAGIIWRTLAWNGECTLPKLKKSQAGILRCMLKC